MRIRNILAIVILAIGSTQMIGALTGFRALRGIGLASGIAPYTKVFCDTGGYEAFAATFTLSGSYPDGTPWEEAITPELYSGLHGPYNRRNVYGAALAFAPRLPDKLRDELINQSIAHDSLLRNELSIPPEVDDLRITITCCQGKNTWSYP